MKKSTYLLLASGVLFAACSMQSPNPYQYKDFTYYQHHLDEAKQKAASCAAKMQSDIGKPPSDPKLSQEYFFKKEQYMAVFRASDAWPECNAASLVVKHFFPAKKGK